MSDPVSNAEIEDVLASIRRLVADEPGRMQQKSEAPGADEPDKLILTPAQRVSGDDEAAETGDAEADDAEADDAVAGDAEAAAPARGLRYDQTLAQRIAELESAISQSGADWEPDGSETETDATEPLGLGPATSDEIFTSAAGASTDAAGEAAAPAGTLREAETGPSADAAAVAAEPEFPGRPDDAPGPQPAPEGSHADAPEEDIDRAGSFLDAEEGHDWTDAEAGERWSDAAADDAYEDDDEAPEDGPGPSRLDLSGEAAVLDEEALRQMVSDMVRDELQGVLGERITRNVRRLVRREIQRALAARDIG